MTATSAAVEAVWRIESGRLVAALARITGDFPAAEDLAQDALEVALKQWPRDGIPDHPASWLMATAKHLAATATAGSRTSTASSSSSPIQQTPTETGEDPMADVDEELDASVYDDLLRLIFTACHPVAQRRLAGRPDAAHPRRAADPRDRPRLPGQRNDRGAADLRGPRRPWPNSRSGSSCRPPTISRHDSRPSLGVVYLIFNEGYSATAGTTGPGPPSVRTPYGSGGSWSAFSPSSPRPTACWP